MRFDTDRLVSSSAMLVGLGSLFIVVYRTALLREQQQASARPYLMIDLQSNSERSYVFARNHRSVYGDRRRVTSDGVVPKPL